MVPKGKPYLVIRGGSSDGFQDSGEAADLDGDGPAPGVAKLDCFGCRQLKSGDEPDPGHVAVDAVGSQFGTGCNPQLNLALRLLLAGAFNLKNMEEDLNRV